MRASRIAALVAALLVLPVAAGSVFLASLDRGAVRTRVIAEVQRATGRTLSVGALRLRLLPELTLDADDVALANPPGFRRGAMITARHLHATVALLPLLDHLVVVRTLTLNGADLQLERRADAAANWHFTPLPRAATPLRTGAGPATLRLRLDRLRVLGVTADGELGYVAPGHAAHASIQALRLREVNASSTISASVDAIVDGAPETLAGQFGGQTHLWNVQDRAPWPVSLRLVAPSGTLELQGTVRRPRALAEYDLAIRARGPDPAQLVAGWIDVPRLRDVALDMRLVDQADGIDVPRLALTAGASNLDATVPGLKLDALSVQAPNVDGAAGTRTNQISARGRYAAQALALQATLGPVGRLFGRGPVGPRRPIVLDATATAAGATLRLQGQVVPAGDWSGTDATVHAAIPDLAALQPLVPRPLPVLRDVTLDARVQSAGGVLILHGGQLHSPLADLRAEATMKLAGRPRYTAQVAVAHLDIDAVRAAWPKPVPPLPDTRPTAPAAGPSLLKPATPTSLEPTPSGLSSPWMVPDTALRLEPLRGFDAELSLTADTLVFRAVPIAKLVLHAALAQGRLVVEPASAQLDGVTARAALSLDAGRAPPFVTLTAHAPGLRAETVAALLGGPGLMSGRLDLDAALTATGASAHALAADSAGHLGVALTDGTVDDGLLMRALTQIAPVGQLGLSLPKGGRSDVACLATRLDIASGVAVPRAFQLDTKRFRLTAAGAVDLRDETFALRLRPYVMLGSTGLVLPSRADGSWRTPRLTLEPASGAASAASLARGLSARLGITLGGTARSAETLLDQADRGDCGAALAAARDPGVAAPASAAPAAPPAPPTSRKARVLDLLHRLLR